MGFVHCLAMTLLWKPEVFSFVLLGEKQKIVEYQRFTKIKWIIHSVWPFHPQTHS